MEKVITYINDKGAVTILVASENGRLQFLGDDWKECPRPEKPCPRHSMRENNMPENYDMENPHPKCRYCTWRGDAHLKNQEQAYDVALLIVKNLGKVPLGD